MTRSITGTPQGRRGGLRLRAAALLVAPVAALAVLAGCSAGQVSQTDTIKAAVTGVSANSADGTISLRNVMIEYGGPEGYPPGAAVPLRVYIVNNSVSESANLLGVDVVAGGGRVALLGGAPVTAPASSAPSASPSAAGSASASASPRPSASAPVSAGASPSPSPSPTLPAPRLEIKPNELVALVRTTESDPAYLALVGRTEKLDNGAPATLVFHFDRNRDITVVVTAGVPLSPLPRGSAVVSANEG